MQDKVKATLESVLTRFENNSIPEAIAIACFPACQVPSSKWSLMNRVIMAMSGTADARGIRQWNQAGRRVQKGAKAFYILAPRLIPDKAAQPDEQGQQPSRCIGFFGVPVFKVEDTEGQALDYQRLELPAYELDGVAAAWGIRLAAVPGNGRFLGRYASRKSVISLATPDESTFYHELAHAAHEKIKGTLKPGQDWKQEVVAELSAAVLCHLSGHTGDATLGNSYRYIKNYAAAGGKDTLRAIAAVIADVEKVLNLILTTAQDARLAA